MIETQTLTVRDGSEMRAHVARPKTPRGQEGRGVIVLQEAFGVNDYIRRMATRMAARGYLAIAPELFHRSARPGLEFLYTDFKSAQPHLQALTGEGIAADLRACFDWLVAAGIEDDNIAALGFCMGGRAAFLANLELPLAASVSFYGGGMRPLLPRVSEVHGPALLIWGGSDPNIPVEDTRAVADALKAAHKPFVEATFSEAGHGFACDAREAYHPKSASEAWALVDEFLENNLL